MRDHNTIPEDNTRLVQLEAESSASSVALAVDALKKDMVVLLEGLSPSQADEFVVRVAAAADLTDCLKLQAGFANFLGHRERVGEYFMSVSSRSEYQFISPHSEGSSFIGMQLASFYCYENSTDGGETILLNVNSSSHAWSSLREVRVRGKASRVLARHELARLGGLYQINLPEDELKEDDHVLKEENSAIKGLSILRVLAKPQTVLSRLTNQYVYAYWDSIAGIDFDSAEEFECLLRNQGLLKEPLGGLPLPSMDSSANRRIFKSGVRYKDIFKCTLTRKLRRGDLIVLNNLSWTHSAANWTPGSGLRKVCAAFA